MASPDNKEASRGPASPYPLPKGHIGGRQGPEASCQPPEGRRPVLRSARPNEMMVRAEGHRQVTVTGCGRPGQKEKFFIGHRPRMDH